MYFLDMYKEYIRKKFYRVNKDKINGEDGLME